ncbi:3-hydroxyacyl-CoA dehydrogenase family protein [Pseudomonas aeruginosa]|nr:3-hydroxyacyl-CoA dehydrogenase family protein [Pseudomonas aeruginosa]
MATTGEIDDAIRFGAGLRWSFMGTFLTYTLAGGNAGMRHFMAQFGPALQLPWTYLPAPELYRSPDRPGGGGHRRAAGAQHRRASSATATTACWRCSGRSGNQGPARLRLRRVT